MKFGVSFMQWHTNLRITYGLRDATASQQLDYPDGGQQYFHSPVGGSRVVLRPRSVCIQWVVAATPCWTAWETGYSRLSVSEASILLPVQIIYFLIASFQEQSGSKLAAHWHQAEHQQHLSWCEWKALNHRSNPALTGEIFWECFSVLKLLILFHIYCKLSVILASGSKSRHIHLLTMVYI